MTQEIGKYIICVPSLYSYAIEDRIIHLPKDVYDHKKYPSCHCGLKYVPTKLSPKQCLYCFNKKSIESYIYEDH